MSPVILKLARRYISRRLLQSVLFMIGVALGVAVVIAIDLANTSASRAFSLSTESITGKATHQILAGPSGLPSDVYRDLRLDLGLRDSAPIVEEYVRTDETLGSQPLHILGVDPFAEPPFRDYLTTVNLIGAPDASEADEGGSRAFAALSAFIAEPNTALISGTLAERYGLSVGDTITLRPQNASVEARVVGILQAVDDTSAAAIDDLVLTDIATAQELLGRPGQLSRIDLILPEGYDLTLIEALLPEGARVASVAAESGILQQMTAAFELNLQALSLLALVVGVFLIYNTVTFNVVQRRPVIGILRSLGATRGQIFTLILSESVLMGLVGTVLGMGLGIIFGRVAVNIVSRTISDLYFAVNVQSVTITPFTLLKGAAIGLGASILAAVVPSWDATRTAPAGVMRRSVQEESTRRLVPYVTIGAVALNLAGVLLLQIRIDNDTLSILFSFTALFAIVVGSAFFTPIALIAVMRISTPITDRLFGVLGRMAPRAVTRSLSRTSVAVAALTVAISVIVGVSTMIGSFRNTVGDWLEATLGADIFISSPLLTSNRAEVDVDPAVVDLVAAVDGVAQVATARSVYVTAPDYPDLPPVNIIAGSLDIAGGGRRYIWLNEPQGVAEGDYWGALESGLISVSEPFAFRRGITPENNTLTLLTDDGPHTFTVAGVFYDYSTDQGIAFMSDATYREFFDDPYISSLAAFIEPDADLNTVIDRIRAEALTGYDLQAQSNRSLRAGVFEVFEQAFSITVALRLLAMLVAFIGILSALMSLQLEQTRQYGLMRAVGLTPRQLWNYTLIQTGLMGTTAGLLALPVGLALAVVLVYVINVRSFGWTMEFSVLPDELLQAFAVAVLAALAAGLYPAWRLTKLVTAVALRSE